MEPATQNDPKVIHVGLDDDEEFCLVKRILGKGLGSLMKFDSGKTQQKKQVLWSKYWSLVGKKTVK